MANWLVELLILICMGIVVLGIMCLSEYFDWKRERGMKD